MDLENIVVIGGSAGSIEVLKEIVSDLPADLHAGIIAVVHTSPSSARTLPQILNRSHTIAASYPQDGQRIQAGRLYVAPPDLHLYIDDGKLRLSHGPRENLARPSIDVLFRSAAQFAGGVTGVLLSGCLDDGVMGLIDISASGGTTVVQEPSDASYPDLPLSGINKDHVDFVLPAAEIGEFLARQVEQPRRANVVNIHREKSVEKPLSLSCPACGGVLRMSDEKEWRYKCRVGHSYGTASLLEDQTNTIETAFWTAVRALQERKMILDRILHRMSSPAATERIRGQIKDINAQDALLRQVIERGLPLLNEPPPDILDEYEPPKEQEG